MVTCIGFGQIASAFVFTLPKKTVFGFTSPCQLKREINLKFVSPKKIVELTSHFRT